MLNLKLFATKELTIKEQFKLNIQHRDGYAS
jgi:hypothetical protein